MTPYDIIAWSGASIVVAIAAVVILFAVQALRVLAKVNIPQHAAEAADAVQAAQNEQPRQAGHVSVYEAMKQKR